MTCILLLAGALIIPAGDGPPASPPLPERERAPTAVLAAAINDLREEARAALAEGHLPRSEPSFAEGVEGRIPPAMVGARLIRPLDRDPFVDAYVRWQLTGFRVELPDLDDRDFDRLLRQLPALSENPWADRTLLNELNAIVQAGPLGASQAERLEQRLESVAESHSRARAMSVPGERLREWLALRFRDDSFRRLRLTMEHCAARVEAGWEAERQKQQVEELCAFAGDDETLTEGEVRLLTVHARRLAGRSRLVAAGARIRDDALAVDFVDTGIYDFDVTRWIRRLSGN